MTLEIFRQMIAHGKPLEGKEMIQFMRNQSDLSRKLQFELNCKYHTPREIRELFGQIIEQEMDEEFGLFPPFYTDFGRNIHVGKKVFINSCCHFQDQGGIYIGDGCLIGHCVVLATLNHDHDPAKRQNLHHAPIRIGKGVWIGANVTITGGSRKVPWQGLPEDDTHSVKEERQVAYTMQLRPKEFQLRVE